MVACQWNTAERERERGREGRYDHYICRVCVWVHYHAVAAAYSRPQLARLSTALEGHGPGPATPGEGGGGIRDNVHVYNYIQWNLRNPDTLVTKKASYG